MNNAMPTPKKYYTHAGVFHADEITGYAICVCAGAVSGTEDSVIRLTDLTNIPDDGIVADIGREHNPEELRFDHHQGFFLRDNGYPLASAGMLWKAFGEEAVAQVAYQGTHPPGEDLKFIADRVDETLIQGIDAHDADSTYKVTATCSAGTVRINTLSNIIASLNQDNDHDQPFAWFDAYRICRRVLEAHIWAAYRHLKAVRKFDSVVTPKLGGEVLVLAEGLPWKEIVHEKYPDAAFVIAPSNHPGSPYSMIAVPFTPDSRKVKVPIGRPEWFDGFIHQGQWIAGGTSVDELLRLAEENLQV